MRRTQVEVLRLWVKALRSGEYNQTQKMLRTSPMYRYVGFCCMGVLCDLARKDGGPEWDHESYMGEVGKLPDVMREWLGLSRGHVGELIYMNDSRFDFQDIADFIERVLLPAAERRMRLALQGLYFQTPSRF